MLHFNRKFAKNGMERKVLLELLILIALLALLFFTLAKHFGWFTKNTDQITQSLDADTCKAQYVLALNKPDDVDGDQYPDSCDNCVYCDDSTFKDTDGDGIGDQCDTDKVSNDDKTKEDIKSGRCNRTCEDKEKQPEKEKESPFCTLP